MSDAGWDELAAVRSSFCGLIARWRLTQGELRILLGEDWGVEQRWMILPMPMTPAAEQRMRLLVRFERALSRIVPDDGLVARWLRESNAACGGATPLLAMGGLQTLRALLVEAEGRTGLNGGGPGPILRD